MANLPMDVLLRLALADRAGKGVLVAICTSATNRLLGGTWRDGSKKG
jgi:hypothetical protein